MAKPKSNTERLVVYVPLELKQSIQKEAEGKGIDVSTLVRMILSEREQSKK